VPELVQPAMRYQESVLTALVEFHAEGRHPELSVETLRDREAFARYLYALRADALPQTSRRTGWVPSTHLWWVDDDRFLGRISIRHELNASLRRIGGHVGYEIRPSARRQGHATAMLAAALGVANKLGIDPALITCDVSNVASRRVIEANGGRYTGRDDDELQFLVPTS
jgi:predicted acetyltransferase